MIEEPRIPRKKGQPAGSDKHSDLYTDENPKGTIHGLGFKDVATARASVKKIENSGKTHAHKIQAAIAMEQRAKVMGKTAEAAVYRKFIEKMKKITKQKQQNEEKMACPAATQDLKLNTKNRDATIKSYNYGPLNVDEPGDYWKDIAKYWKTTEDAAKKSLCNNCVAFDVSPRMLECMPGETSDKDGRLGYCWMHHFKCHSARSCHTWAKGGPITTDEKSYDWQERGQKKESVTFRKFNEKTEAVVFTFGRFNPPTTGHEKLIQKVAKVAGGDDFYIFPSHSQNPKKDPLSFAKKVAYMRNMFPRYKRNILATNMKTVLDIAVYFQEQGYKEMKMVVGSDRVAEFNKLLTTYNGKDARHGFYDFDNIQVISAGDRDPDAEGVTGMSASKMRAAASSNDYESFKKGLPMSFKNGNKLFKDVRKGMGLRENSTYSEAQIERDLYIRGVLYQVGDLVENIDDGTFGKVVRRGTNYVQYAEDGKVYKAFLYHIREKKEKEKQDVKQDKDIKDREGTQPAKYYAKDAEGDDMAKSTKQARARHFAKYGKKDDDTDSNYKPAPGDASAKTKPSKHTKKFKQMFGELENESLWANIHKKRQRIKRGSGERMRKPGEKGAPTPAQMKRAKGEENIQEKIEGLVKKAEKSGMPYGILKKVYDRGMAAWKTGHRPGTTPQQWAFARVNSFVTKSSGTWGGADKDLAKQVKCKKEAYEIGQDYAKHTFSVTPGQNYNQALKKKASKQNIKDWFERESTRKEYQDRYKKDWEERLKETYDRMLNKLEDSQDNKYIEKLEIVESEYQGRKVKLNDPFRLPSGSGKKFGVYVKNEKGNVVKVTFGDPNMDIKRDSPERRASFRARHNCDNPGPKTKARYWSCYQWRAGAKVDN